MRLDLYDERGNLVATRVDQEVAAGRLGTSEKALLSRIKRFGAVNLWIPGSNTGLTARPSGKEPAKVRPWVDVRTGFRQTGS
jgi:methyl coenzyme M reductase beta subunit